MRTGAFESRSVAVGFVFQHCAAAYGESVPAACAASVIVVPDYKMPRIESLNTKTARMRVRPGADVEANCIDTG
jgi:hypothetical protein